MFRLRDSSRLEGSFLKKEKNDIKVPMEGGFYSFSPFYNGMLVQLYILVHYSRYPYCRIG
jgi:hypothetical protein